jgi:hypothetical protein
VVGERDRVRVQLQKGCAARFARRRLQSAVLLPDFHPNRHERNVKLKAKRPAEFLPLVRVRAQAVVDVGRREPVAELRREDVQRVQQYHRIDTAR